MNLIVLGVVLPWLVVCLFVGMGAWIGFQLIHQNGRLLSRLEGLEQQLQSMAAAPLPALPPLPAPALAPSQPAGLRRNSPAPAFELPDLNGGRQSLAQLRGRRLLLIFFNPGCGFCTQMAAALAALPVDGLGGRPIPVVVSTGGAEENRRLIAEYGMRGPMLLQQGMEVAAQYQCNGTPMGYLIDEQGRIASEMAVGGPGLLALAAGPPASGSGANGPAPADANGNRPAALGGQRGVEESRIERHGLPAGSTAPEFRLPLLFGGELALSEYRGRPVLLVFSDPHCGPCDLLAPQLERQSRSQGEVQVLMVSRGEVEANRAKTAEHGLTFPVLLQRQWEISREYAMFATPIAYLIDEAGILVADAAVGVEPILVLLSGAAGPARSPAAEERCRCGQRRGECGCTPEKARARIARRNGR